MFKLEPLGIDGEIRKRMVAIRPPFIQGHVRPFAVSFGRRALEITIHAAEMEDDQNPERDEWEPRWLDLRDVGGKAERAIEAMLRTIQPDDIRRTGRVRPRPWRYVTLLLHTRLGVRSGDRRALEERARHDIAVLLQARSIARRLARDADQRRRHFTAQITNRDVKKNAFVGILAEAWIYLTGEPPGKGVQKGMGQGGNPFLNFVEAAWGDRHAGAHPEENFVSALRNVLRSVNDYQVQTIGRDGPAWGEPLPHLRALDQGSGLSEG